MKLSILTCTGVVFGDADDSHATSNSDETTTLLADKWETIRLQNIQVSKNTY